MLKKIYCKLTDIFLENLELENSKKILDVGCGDRGNFLKIPSNSYVGIDINERIISALRKREDGEYRSMDAKKLIFQDYFFDGIISTSFFHHFSDKECLSITAELNRVLKNKGILVVADGIYPESYFNLLGWGIRFFDRGRFVRKKESFKKIFVKHFKTKKEYYFVNKIFAYSVLIMEKN